MARGEALALPELAHAVHVEVRGLRPRRDYFYRFTAGGERSPIGRARTAPAPGDLEGHVAFGVASCQSYQSGYFTALRHLADEELDAVLHLGDYIYESGNWGRSPVRNQGTEVVEPRRVPQPLRALQERPRPHGRPRPPPVRGDLGRPRGREQLRERPLLGRRRPSAQFLKRRAAAYQAFYEHLPLRRSSMPRGPNLRLYRRLSYGGLAEVHVLDTRQYRTDQPCGDGQARRCAGAHDPKATLLGAEQRDVVPRGPRPLSRALRPRGEPGALRPDRQRRPGPTRAYDVDKWDGYLAERRTLTEAFGRRGTGPVFVTGDMHSNAAVDLLADFDDERSAVVGAEFIGTSISTAGDGDDLPSWGATILRENPHVRFFNGQRGYLRCTVTAGRLTTDFRVLEYVKLPGSPVSTRASFVLEHGRPGIQKA